MVTHYWWLLTILQKICKRFLVRVLSGFFKGFQSDVKEILKHLKNKFSNTVVVAEGFKTIQNQ